MKSLRKINLYKKMNVKIALAYVEGKTVVDQEKMLCAWQFLVDTHTCWKKDLWHSYMAFTLIERNFIERS